MSKSREVLESTYQRGRMKRVRNIVYGLELALTFALIAIVALVSHAHLSLYPLYLPMDSFLYILAVMAIVGNVQGFFFKNIGIKYGKTDSERFLMIKGYIQKSFAIVIVFIVILGLLGAQLTTNIIGGNFTQTGELEVTGSSATPAFDSEGSFGLVHISKIEFVVDGDDTVNFYFLKEAALESIEIEDEMVVRSKMINSGPGLSDSLSSLEYTPKNLVYDSYVLVFYTTDGLPANLTYTIHRVVIPSFAITASIFCAVFIAANMAWIFYLRPLKTLYRKSSIYT